MKEFLANISQIIPDLKVDSHNFKKETRPSGYTHTCNFSCYNSIASKEDNI